MVDISRYAGRHGIRVTMVGLVAALAGGCTETLPGGSLATPFRQPTIAEPKDFVRESRPATTDYIPVHAQQPERRIRPKTATELADTERELGGVAKRHAGEKTRLDEARRRTLAASPKPPKRPPD